MKRIFLLVALLGFIAQVEAQTYGNEWINYNQSYFKFRLVNRGVYRIPISDLNNVGLPSSVQGSNFQLIKDGVEVPIFVSSNTALTGSDYIEFVGMPASGITDTALYKNPAHQLNPNMSLISDSSYYFLTYNNLSTNKRYTPRANNLTSPPLKESFFWETIQVNYRNTYVSGKSYFGANQVPVIYLTSSQYEEGEGFCKNLTFNNDSVTVTCTNPYLVGGGPFATFKTALVGSSYLPTHRVKIFANNNELADSTFSSFGFRRYNLVMPMTMLNAQNKVVFKFTPLNSIPSQNLYDRYGISYYEFRYPKQFNFDNKTSYYFELNPKVTDYYLEISNFNTGGVAPRLYDMSSQEYLTGDISVAGLVRFLIPSSTDIKRFILKSEGSIAHEQVQDLKAVSFKNYTLASNQGDYILLSHKNYINDPGGAINNYKSYRSSIAGGAYNTTVADVLDVYDEFGYGYPLSSLALKNFLKFATNNVAWAAKPKHVLLVGKGISYNNYRTYQTNPFTTYPFHLVPSFGEPASDILLSDFDKDNRPKLSIGRIPAMTANDIQVYLNKVKDHEALIATSIGKVSDSVLWQKQVLHIAGSSNLIEQSQIVGYLNNHTKTIGSSNYGGRVTTLLKSSTSEVESINSELLDKLFNNGLGLVQFFGHSSASGMDYNLDFPENYSNYRKYPLFIANGCGAGNIFGLTGQKSLGERFVFAQDRGSIAFVAMINTGLLGTLGLYTDTLYSEISKLSYGSGLGIQLKNNVNRLTNRFPSSNELRLHCEQIVLDGDPAVSTFNYAKPDYAIEEKGILFNEQNITTSLDSVEVKIVVHNLGRHSGDSVSLLVTRKIPNGVDYTYISKKLGNLSYSDTLNLKIPTLGDNAVGVNTLEVRLDNESIVDELSEANNNLVHSFTIYNDDLVPIHPYNFSIVNSQGVTLKASTLNPFVDERKYLIQIDTTEKFNSPQLRSTTIASTGGVVKWQPMLNMQDSMVYYWRTAMDTLYGNKTHRWSTSSFVYIPQSLPGWNQSHYYQFQDDSYNQIVLDSASRTFKFDALQKKLQVQNVCMYAPSPNTYDWPDYVVKINGSTSYTFGCDPWPGYSSLQIMVIDTLTGLPWRNAQVGNAGRFGSFKPCRECDQSGNNCKDPFFEFSFLTQVERKRIIDFIDSIPQGYYMMIQPRLCVGTVCGTRNSTFIRHWMADTTALGSGVSLYHKLKNLGYSKIDSFYKNRSLILFSRKGNIMSVQQYVGNDSTTKLYGEFDFKSSMFIGSITSTDIGPASAWSNFIKKGFTSDPQQKDSVKFDLIAIDRNGMATLMTTVQGDTSLSFIDAKQYPRLQLRMHNGDNSFATPEQLKYWRVHYQPVPEAALNPNRYFTFKDSIGQGQKTNIGLAIENLTDLPMDSMLVKFELIDNNKNKTLLGMKKYKPLAALDTLHADFEFSSSSFSGNNILYIEANPDQDQPEQYHPNNIGYKSMYIEPDKKNPLIDVTFDGVHIMDKDIVSSKPFILISLRDENKFLPLDDTSLISVYMRYPGDNPSTERYIPHDGNTLKFIPAIASEIGTKNRATLEYRPHFTIDGDDYMLIVKARDKAGNEVGTYAYKVGFEVINKASVSAVVNYPNPFTTSTQFVFTLTGSEIPSQFKIQIMTPTGKVVREIQKNELGPLHIGRNITEFKWKGDDQYGQPLGNGVYLYRVVTSLNGEKMDNYTSGADKWIEKGFGKLYIMR